ncbi:hypothetical protein AURDEDRAFT_77566 [Auricularia subglabra TFB-10046 SS5]|uniref:F-box domain-containing protein n=1 Tax=Auricularia subglabra (strain TFB-10046 / SS5) TaxID=717982 RepID=J0CQW3_AURST|nr:hypothetical protein AURDEDRAFT_77566 [Auricularia subglabra TFB-10046 SS5]
MVPRERLVWEILPFVLVFLTFPDLQCLAKTCNSCHTLLDIKLHRLYNIDAFLAELFNHPAEFRYLQACTGLLVSGSQALQFLDRNRYGSADVDLYVGARAAFVVVDWLLLRGYVLLSQRSPFRHERASCMAEVLRHARVPGSSYFLRQGHALYQFTSPCGRRKIDLIVATRSALSAVLDFHSSKSFTSPVTNPLLTTLHPQRP